MSALVVLLSVIVLVLIPTHLPANPSVIVAMTEFEEDLGGWELVAGPPEQLTWEPSGGNPESYARFEDTALISDFASAPFEFLGDWSFLDGVGYLHWDLRVIRLGSNPTVLDYRVVISGPGGRAVYSLPGPPATTGWEPITAHIFEGAWNMQVGTWSGVLSQVDTLLIRIEMVDNGEPVMEGDVVGLDSVILGSPYSSVLSGSVLPMSWGAIKALWPEF